MLSRSEAGVAGVRAARGRDIQARDEKLNACSALLASSSSTPPDVFEAAERKRVAQRYNFERWIRNRDPALGAPRPQTETTSRFSHPSVHHTLAPRLNARQHDDH